MAKKFTPLLDLVRKGGKINFEGLPTGIESFSKYFSHTQRGRYYLIGGDSGAGKTTFTDSTFILNPYHHLYSNGKEINTKWNYISLEQSRETKYARWASSIIYKEFNVLIPSNVIVGRAVRKLKKSEAEYIKRADDYLAEMLDYVDIVDHSLDSESYYSYLIDYGNKHGKFVVKEEDLEVEEDSKKLSTLLEWIPNNPNINHIFVLDHMAYMDTPNMSLKDSMDKVSRRTVELREITGWTFVYIQQFNTELGSVERQKFKKEMLAPTRQDFGDSRYTFRDADVVIGLINPSLYKIDKYMKIDNVSDFGGLAVWSFLMKNRHDGPIDKHEAFLMNPIGLEFEAIPEDSDAMTYLSGGEVPSERLRLKSKEIEKIVQTQWLK